MFDTLSPDRIPISPNIRDYFLPLQLLGLRRCDKNFNTHERSRVDSDWIVSVHNDEAFAKAKKLYRDFFQRLEKSTTQLIAASLYE